MDFETTTCISIENLELLSTLARHFDLPLHSFIVYMIIYAAKKEKAHTQVFKSITYRKRSSVRNWKRVHLYLQYKEYEYLLDVKKVWKMSVAKAIEFCVEQVLDEFVEYLNEFIRKEKEGRSDNYLAYEINRSYIFEYDTAEGVHCLRLYWGLPQKYARFTL